MFRILILSSHNPCNLKDHEQYPLSLQYIIRKLLLILITHLSSLLFISIHVSYHLFVFLNPQENFHSHPIIDLSYLIIKIQEVYSSLITLTCNQLSLYISSKEYQEVIKKFLPHLLINFSYQIRYLQGVYSILIILTFSQSSLYISFIEFQEVIEKFLCLLIINFCNVILKFRVVNPFLLDLTFN